MALLERGFLDDPEIRAGLGAAMLEEMHNSSLLIHMPTDGTPESQACTEHVLPGIYSREELERLAAFNQRKRASTGLPVPNL